jgi:NAD(P)-dependent dehydrogenase (short-subunit alcohol dehydrogenase family)
MAKLRTLGAILEHLSGSTAASTRVLQLPKQFTVNGLVRLGTRRVDEAPNLAVAPSLERAAIIGALGDALTDAVSAGLRKRGIAAVVTNDATSDSDTVIFIDSADSRSSLEERAQRAFQAARQFATSRGTNGGMFVTLESGASPLRAGLAALVKTVALEYPNCVARGIEIEPGFESAGKMGEIVVGEILSGYSAPEVLLGCDGSRKVVEDLPMPIGHDYDMSLLADNPVIVVTGGARGVTAACLTALAETAPVRLALLGRTEAAQEPSGYEHARTEAELKSAVFANARAAGEKISPKEADVLARRILASREVTDALQRLRGLGAETEYFAVDVADAASVAEALRAVRKKWGRIDGVIHAAGVIADKPIADKSPEQFARVFGTKVPGFEALLNATREDDLRFIFAFTSVAGRYGNSGQADYAMANATVSQMARDEAARRGASCVVRTMSWGPWQGGMVTPDLQSHFAARGISLIPMDRGVAAFMQELCHTSTDPAGIDVVLAAR